MVSAYLTKLSKLLAVSQLATKSITWYGDYCDMPICLPRRNQWVFSEGMVNAQMALPWYLGRADDASPGTSRWWTPSYRLMFRPHRSRLMVPLRQQLRKLSKYSYISQTHTFNPIALKTIRSINTEGLNFGEWLVSVSGDPRKSSFCFKSFLYCCNGSVWLLSVALSPRRHTSKFSHSRLVFSLSY